MEENQNEGFDSINESVDDTQNQSDEPEVQTDEEKEKLRETNRKLYDRTKKAEAELKALKAQGQPHITNQPDLSDELKLIARGLSDEEIEKAKVIAKGNGTSLQEALKDDMFIAYQTKLKEDKRKEDAKLGASRGSGESEDDTLIKPDMTREEHQAAFKKVMG